jgi:hypothetical protein
MAAPMILSVRLFSSDAEGRDGESFSAASERSSVVFELNPMPFVKPRVPKDL